LVRDFVQLEDCPLAGLRHANHEQRAATRSVAESGRLRLVRGRLTIAEPSLLIADTILGALMRAVDP